MRTLQQLGLGLLVFSAMRLWVSHSLVGLDLAHQHMAFANLGLELGFPAFAAIWTVCVCRLLGSWLSKLSQSGRPDQADKSSAVKELKFEQARNWGEQ